MILIPSDHFFFRCAVCTHVIFYIFQIVLFGPSWYVGCLCVVSNMRVDNNAARGCWEACPIYEHLLTLRTTLRFLTCVKT
jgi:hypothetical protein